jgi:hypothetical protein
MTLNGRITANHACPQATSQKRTCCCSFQCALHIHCVRIRALRNHDTFSKCAGCQITQLDKTQRPHDAHSTGCLQHSFSRARVLRELIKQQFQVFRMCAEKYLAWAEFGAIVVLSGLPCKQSGGQGATHVLYVALNGKEVSCLQSERNALCANPLCPSIESWKHRLKCLLTQGTSN